MTHSFEAIVPETPFHNQMVLERWLLFHALSSVRDAYFFPSCLRASRKSAYLTYLNTNRHIKNQPTEKMSVSQIQGGPYMEYSRSLSSGSAPTTPGPS
jgi:hypothetical protein